MPPLDPEDLEQARVVLGKILAALESGAIEDGGPRGIAIRRRIEGALAALDALAEPDDMP